MSWRGIINDGFSEQEEEYKQALGIADEVKEVFEEFAKRKKWGAVYRDDSEPQKQIRIKCSDYHYVYIHITAGLIMVCNLYHPRSGRGMLTRRVLTQMLISHFSQESFARLLTETFR